MQHEHTCVTSGRIRQARRPNECSFGVPSSAAPVPAIMYRAGGRASQRFLEFFTAGIRNINTRKAYYRAVRDFLLWSECRVTSLDQIQPVLVAAYVETLLLSHSKPTVKQHLAAIKMLFDWLLLGQVIPANPAACVRGPSYVVKRGKTPVLSSAEARQLLDSVETSSLVGLRDRALIGVMVYTFARVSAVSSMNVGDYYPVGKRYWLRFHEKGGKFHEVPAHHNAEAYLDTYLEGAGISGERQSPLFRTLSGRTGRLNGNRMTRSDILRMVKRRSARAGLPANVCCHTFRATGITAYLENGGTIENAQAIAGHESPRTTKLYDRTDDRLTLDEIERIAI